MVKDNSYKEVIRELWGEGQQSGMAWEFNRKIFACQKILKTWNKHSFGHVNNTLKKKFVELKSAEEGGGYLTDPAQVHHLREEFQKLQSKEECMWKQRPRNSWLIEVDKNTKYFHCRANQRNRQNLILGLEDDAGSWVENETEMSYVVERYLQDIFTSANPSSFDTILDGIQHTMVDDLNPNMGGDFLAIEVQQALSQMARLKTPGPNSMSSVFYKSFWHIVGKDVTAVVLRALNLGIVLESINTTFISLIPKIKNPKKIGRAHV